MSDLFKHWSTYVGLLAMGLLGYAFYAGLSGTITYQSPINGQTSRNIFFHVPMWFAMMVMMYTSVATSVMYLRGRKMENDLRAAVAAKIGVLFGLMGLITGIVWSRVTWYENLDGLGAWWAWEPKLTFASICLLIYGGYFVLRGSFEDPDQRARISATYNIFAAATVYPLLYVLPKRLGQLHPNSQGDSSAVMTLSPDYYSIFWPSVLGFICLAVWIWSIQSRMNIVQHQIEEWGAE